MIDSRPTWYCVQTHPRKEERVSLYLRTTLGLETYYPRLRRRKTIRRVKRVVTGPLFPRYLFCRFEFDMRYNAVRYSPEVTEVVGFGSLPAAVDDALISGLKTWAAEEVDVITVERAFLPGDNVEIIDGPLRGLSAVIQSGADERDRVAVILSILERDVRMKIERWQLARVV